MRIRKIIAATTAAAAALAGGMALSSPAVASPKDDTLLELISSKDRYTNSERGNGLDRFRWSQRNWYDYDILTKLVVLDGNLVGPVTDPSAELTLFAPNDRAFQLLAKDLTGRWYWTETKVFRALKRAVNSGAVDLTNVLTYHVVGGKVVKADVPVNTPIATLNGGEITVKPKRFGLLRIADEVDAFRNPYIVRTDLGAERSNSVIHTISRVLVPANVGG